MNKFFKKIILIISAGFGGIVLFFSLFNPRSNIKISDIKNRLKKNRDDIDDEKIVTDTVLNSKKKIKNDINSMDLEIKKTKELIKNTPEQPNIDNKKAIKFLKEFAKE